VNRKDDRTTMRTKIKKKLDEPIEHKATTIVIKDRIMRIYMKFSYKERLLERSKFTVEEDKECGKELA
jgi:hypothetical protein